jgi:hypothetical protein
MPVKTDWDSSFSLLSGLQLTAMTTSIAIFEATCRLTTMFSAI